MKSLIALEQNFRICLKAFLSLSQKETEGFISLRMFTLHSLERLTPHLFKKYELEGELVATLESMISTIPLDFTSKLTSEQCLARIDAIWILFQRNISIEKVDTFAIEKCISRLYADEEPMAAWLLEQMACMAHLKKDSSMHLSSKEMPLLIRLYWLTHIIFIATDFMQCQAQGNVMHWAKKELIEAIPIVVKNEWVDIGGEILLCLLCLRDTELHHQELLFNLIRKNQLPNGVVFDQTLAHHTDTMLAHTTAIALLAYGLKLETEHAGISNNIESSLAILA